MILVIIKPLAPHNSTGNFPQTPDSNVFVAVNNTVGQDWYGLFTGTDEPIAILAYQQPRFGALPVPGSGQHTTGRSCMASTTAPSLNLVDAS